MRTWHFTVSEKKHTVQVAHDPIFSGELEVYIDGDEVLNTAIPSGEDYEYAFQVEGKTGKVLINFEGMSVQYTVLVDGKQQPYSGAEDLVSKS